jgi:prevent-host-death family protein
VSEVTIRELRNHGGRVLRRVARGEALTVTRDGDAVAELRPLHRRSLPAATFEAERAARQAHLQQAEADFEPLPFDAQAARALGRVAASLRRAGRKTRARAYDVLIAATALANHLPVYTCNPDDFSGIDGLDVVEVPIPRSPVVSVETAHATPRERRQPSQRRSSKTHRR